MERNGRWDHIEDVLGDTHFGQWFGWSDSKNKVYANLVIHDDSKDKPTSSPSLVIFLVCNFSSSILDKNNLCTLPLILAFSIFSLIVLL